MRIIYKDGRVDEGLIWNARELGGLTIKSEVENKDYRVTTELKNIVLKTPAATLFEIPAGYTEAKGFMDLTARSRKASKSRTHSIKFKEDEQGERFHG